MKTLLLAFTLALVSFGAQAMETREITIKDHKFDPAIVSVPADTRVKLVVHNQDSTPAEFESDDFKREKILPGNSTANVFVSPLAKGEYKFFDEFNKETTQGILKVE